MPRKRRLHYTPSKKSKKLDEEVDGQPLDREVRAARGRLMGALLEVLEAEEGSDSSSDFTPYKKEKQTPRKGVESNSSDDDDESNKNRQSYVLKLFDRSVDLSQFEEDAPLYPICRAWMLNQPKAIYRDNRKEESPVKYDCTIELPGPEGPMVSRVPPLLPFQEQRKKDAINLDYSRGGVPSREELFRLNSERWTSVRRAWMEQSARVEQRYAAAQDLLNRINSSAM